MVAAAALPLLLAMAALTPLPAPADAQTVPVLTPPAEGPAIQPPVVVATLAPRPDPAQTPRATSVPETARLVTPTPTAFVGPALLQPVATVGGLPTPPQVVEVPPGLPVARVNPSSPATGPWDGAGPAVVAVVALGAGGASLAARALRSRSARRRPPP